MFGDISDIIKDIGKTTIIQRESRTAGTYLGDTVTWATQFTLKALIQNMTSSEIIAADKLGVKATHKMFCGVVAATENDRVYVNSTYYQIVYIDNESYQDKFLCISLKEDDNYGSASN